MSITGSNNPFACEPVVFANANQIISLGTITRSGNQFTFSVGFVWKINGVTYQNTAPVVITIAEASEGFNRIDNALLNTSNTIELQQGLESETIALKPVAPHTNIILTSWNISGNTIGDFEDPIIGTSFVKKSFSAHFAFNGSGVDTSIPLNPNGYSEIRVTNPALESIAGVDLSLISGNPSAEVPYTGKIYLLKNITGNAITIKHNSAIADIPFYTNDEQNLEVPNKGSVIFTYDNAACEILLTNFSVGTVSIPSLDEVLEVSGYSERSATVGDFKAKSFQIGDNLMPESSGGLFKVQKNADGTISVVLDSVSHEDSDNFGRLTATLTNEGGVIFRHLDNDNNQGVIATIRKDGIIFSLINSFLKVYKDGSDRDILISGIAQINDIYGLESALSNKASKFFSHKLTTPTSYVTGTVSETEVYRLTIPANTLSASDAIKIPLMLIKKLGTNGTIQVRGKMSTSETMPTGTTDLIFQTPAAAASAQTLGIIKTFFIDNGNLKGTAFTNISYTDNNAQTGAISEKPFDVTVTNYLYISVINGSASDQTRLEAFQLTNS